MRFSLDRIPPILRSRVALATLIIVAVGAFFIAGRKTDVGATLVIASQDFREEKILEV